MQPEELLKMLREAKMADEDIKKLLGDALASLEGPAEGEGEPEADEEAEEREMAGRLLGVTL